MAYGGAWQSNLTLKCVSDVIGPMIHFNNWYIGMVHISRNESYFDFVALNNNLVSTILLVNYIMKNNVIIYIYIFLHIEARWVTYS